MKHELVTDLVQIRQLAAEKLDENLRFRVHLKTHDYPEKRFRQIATEIESRIDCLQCANCCREATTAPNERDIDRLSDFLGVTPEKFKVQYMMLDTDKEPVLKQENDACIFLEGNHCTVYEARPRTCRTYPHLVRSDWSMTSRMQSIVSNSRICPIVYNTLEAYKDVMQFHRRERRARKPRLRHS